MPLAAPRDSGTTAAVSEDSAKVTFRDQGTLDPKWMEALQTNEDRPQLQGFAFQGNEVYVELKNPEDVLLKTLVFQTTTRYTKSSIVAECRSAPKLRRRCFCLYL